MAFPICVNSPIPLYPNMKMASQLMVPLALRTTSSTLVLKLPKPAEMRRMSACCIHPRSGNTYHRLSHLPRHHI